MPSRPKVEARFGEITKEKIEERRNELRKLVGKFSEVLLAYQALGIEEALPIDGATKFDAGVEMIEKYIENIERAAVRHAYKRSPLSV